MLWGLLSGGLRESCRELEDAAWGCEGVWNDRWVDELQRGELGQGGLKLLLVNLWRWRWWWERLLTLGTSILVELTIRLGICGMLTSVLWFFRNFMSLSFYSVNRFMGLLFFLLMLLLLWLFLLLFRMNMLNFLMRVAFLFCLLYLWLVL